jgi:signal peptidase II
VKIRWNIFWFLGAATLLALDLTTKWLAESYLVQKTIEIIPGILKLNFNANTGIAFSVPVPNFTMIILTPVLLAALTWLVIRQCNIGSPITKTILTLFVAGGLGNLINRLTLGAVTDFISFSFWPSFNLADSYLVIAALLLLTLHGKIAVKP